MNLFSNTTPKEIRSSIRSENLNGQTSGLAMGFLQVNVIILPEENATDFQNFCLQNPKPCPLLEKTTPGKKDAGKLAEGVDISSDLPQYQIIKNGEVASLSNNITNHWRDDFVTFYLGCSFSFEDNLIQEGFQLRHIEENKNVPMYQSNLTCKTAGPFQGNTVVSMRPFLQKDLPKVCEITKLYPFAHGDPIQIGQPKSIGIKSIEQPEFGDSITIHPNETPVFWACGVTAIEAVKKANLDFAITHAPGCMLICDVLSKDITTFYIDENN